MLNKVTNFSEMTKKYVRKKGFELKFYENLKGFTSLD